MYKIFDWLICIKWQTAKVWKPNLIGCLNQTLTWRFAIMARLKYGRSDTSPLGKYLSVWKPVWTPKRMLLEHFHQLLTPSINTYIECVVYSTSNYGHLGNEWEENLQLTFLSILHLTISIRILLCVHYKSCTQHLLGVVHRNQRVFSEYV